MGPAPGRLLDAVLQFLDVLQFLATYPQALS